MPLPEELILSLQGGGYVVYIVHVEAGAEVVLPPGDSAAAICGAQADLTPEGAAKAAAIGTGLDRLDIPVGEVIAGPCCGAWQMARLAFEDVPPEVQTEDVALKGAGAAGTAAGDADGADGMASVARSDNLVIIGHADALADLVDGVEDVPGLTHVLRVEDGSLVLEGTIPPDVWLGF